MTCVGKGRRATNVSWELSHQFLPSSLLRKSFSCFCLGINFRLASQIVSGRFLFLHIPTLSKCVLLCKLLMRYIESKFLAWISEAELRLSGLHSFTAIYIWHSIVWFLCMNVAWKHCIVHSFSHSFMPQQCLNIHGQSVYCGSTFVPILASPRRLYYFHTQGCIFFLYTVYSTFFWPSSLPYPVHYFKHHYLWVTVIIHFYKMAEVSQMLLPYPIVYFFL